MDENASKTHRVAWQQIGRRGARVFVVVSAWLGDRLLDAAMWAVNLVRDLPLRLGRLALALWAGLVGVVLALPQARRAMSAGPGLRAWLADVPRRVIFWLVLFLFRVLDLVGVPELWSLLMRLTARVTPLTGAEIAAASAILGPTALRYADVRVAEGGLLNLIFRHNQGRAFTTFHTINMPTFGAHQRTNFAILLHELVHVYQYERTGGLYIAEAIYAQLTTGYNYGSPEDLQQCLLTGVCYRDFNREQQAQLVQDYYERLQANLPVAAYEPYIEEMRSGRV